MQYFKDCATLDEAKKVYRSLLMQFHPDKPNGSHTKTVDLINQFKAFKPTKEAKTDKDFNFDKFHDLIMKFEGLDSVIVSFVGSWIWLSGDTYANKDKIKAIELQDYSKALFSRSKKLWYFKPANAKFRRGTGKSIEQIKSRYGSQEYKTKSFKQLA